MTIDRIVFQTMRVEVEVEAGTSYEDVEKAGKLKAESIKWEDVPHDVMFDIDEISFPMEIE